MQCDDLGTGDEQVFELGEASHQHSQPKSRLSRSDEYMEKWRKRYLELLKPTNRYTWKYSYREGARRKTCVICRRTMVLYNFYSLQKGTRDTTARFCRRCRLRHTQEWRESRLRKRKSSAASDRITKANLDMIGSEQMDLGYDKSHQNRDHEKNKQNSPATESVAIPCNIPQVSEHEEKGLSWIHSAASPDSGTSAVSESLLPPIASILGDIPSVFHPSAMHGTHRASFGDLTGAPKSGIFTAPKSDISNGAITDTTNVPADHSLEYYWYARGRAEQKIMVGLSRTQRANTDQSLLTHLPKNGKIQELEGNAVFFHRDQPDHERMSYDCLDCEEIRAIDCPRELLSERLPNPVLAPSCRVVSDIGPEFCTRESRESLRNTRQDTTSAGQANSANNRLLALAEVASLSTPLTEKPGKHFDASREGASASSNCEDVPPGCPTREKTKIALKLSVVHQKPRLAIPSVEQLDTADGVDMSAIARVIG